MHGPRTVAALLVLVLPLLSGCTGEPVDRQALLLVASPSASQLLYVEGGSVLERAVAGFGAQSLAVDLERSRVYVGSSKAATVAVLDLLTGKNLGTIVTSGGRSPAANFPADIALDAEDHLWVALQGAGLLVRYRPMTHERLTEVQMEQPRWLVPTGEARILAVANSTHVMLLDTAVGLLRPTALANVTVRGIAAHPDGFVVALDRGLRLLSPEGEVVAEAATPALARGLAADAGTLWLSGMDDRLHRLSLPGFRVERSVPLATNVTHMEHDGQGRLFLAFPERDSLSERNAHSLAEIDAVPLGEAAGELAWVRLPGEKRYAV